MRHRRGRPSSPGQPPVRRARWLTLASGAAIPLDVAFVRASRLSARRRRWRLSAVSARSGLLLAVLPVSALLGLLFQWAARVYVEAGTRLRKRTASRASAAWPAAGRSRSCCAGTSRTSPWRPAAQHCGHGGVIARDDARRPTATIRSMGKRSCWPSGAVARRGRDDRAMTRWNDPALVDARHAVRPRDRHACGRPGVRLRERRARVRDSGDGGRGTGPSGGHPAPGPRRILLLGGAVEGLASKRCGTGPAGGRRAAGPRSVGRCFPAAGNGAPGSRHRGTARSRIPAGFLARLGLRSDPGRCGSRTR